MSGVNEDLALPLATGARADRLAARHRERERGLAALRRRVVRQPLTERHHRAQVMVPGPLGQVRAQPLPVVLERRLPSREHHHDQEQRHHHAEHPDRRAAEEPPGPAEPDLARPAAVTPGPPGRRLRAGRLPAGRLVPLLLVTALLVLLPLVLLPLVLLRLPGILAPLCPLCGQLLLVRLSLLITLRLVIALGLLIARRRSLVAALRAALVAVRLGLLVARVTVRLPRLPGVPALRVTARGGAAALGVAAPAVLARAVLTGPVLGRSVRPPAVLAVITLAVLVVAGLVLPFGSGAATRPSRHMCLPPA